MCCLRRRLSAPNSRLRRLSSGSTVRSAPRWRRSARRRRYDGCALLHFDPTMSQRLPQFQAATATDEQKAVLQDILSGPRGNLNGPFLGWIFSPELAQHAQRLGAFCRYQTGLPLRLSELAILVTAARWRSQAEWHIHHPIAIDAGVPPAIAESLRTGERPVFDDDDDELIFLFASELHENRRVSDRTF